MSILFGPNYRAYISGCVICLITIISPTISAITGTIITAVPRGGSMHTTVSIINIYKEGSLAIQQAGKTMSTKILILCKKCPSVKRGESQRCQAPVISPITLDYTLQHSVSQTATMTQL